MKSAWYWLLFINGCYAAEGVRRYNLTLSYSWDAKDGNGRPVYKINGQSPGPVLTVREGETLEAFVSNQLAIETTIHWHGIYQIESPWNDGVPGVSQYSIEPRDNFTYSFKAQKQYGSYFYHGHFGPAFSDGQRGPLWIVPAEWRPRPYSLISKEKADIKKMRAAEENPRHIIIADWNAVPMDLWLIRFRDTGFPPWCANSLTLNGRGRSFCHTPQAIADAGGPDRNTRGCMFKDQIGWQYTNPVSCKDTFAPLEIVEAAQGEEWVWINFINSGAHHKLGISIDEHVFYVVAADGEFVHPQHVHRTHINLGERVSILVKLDQEPGDYAIRLHSLRQEQIIDGMGILRYPRSRKHLSHEPEEIPRTRPWVHLNGTLIDKSHKAMDEHKLSPYPPKPPPQIADTTLRFTVNKTTPSTWVLNAAPHEFFRQQVPPLLWDADSRGPTSYGNSSGFLKNGTVVDLIVENAAGVIAGHPFHKHNHKVYIIGQGSGGFPYSSVDEALRSKSEIIKHINLVNPPHRDGFTLEGGKGMWTIVRYEIDFSAVSMLHCHMIHHFASGQQVILIEGLENMPKVPEELKHKPHADFEMPPRYGPLD